MALKDWKKIQIKGTINPNIFGYKKGLKTIIIEKYMNIWNVNIYSDYGWTSQTREASESFKTKSQALKFAKQYMRKH